ncbi:MAG: hypothetical protein ACRC6E_06775 [Fusobacteriaceae bacterium]
MKLQQILKNMDDMKYGINYETIKEVQKRAKQLKILWNTDIIYILSVHVSNSSDYYIFDNFDDMQDFIVCEYENNDSMIYNIKDL